MQSGIESRFAGLITGKAFKNFEKEPGRSATLLELKNLMVKQKSHHDKVAEICVKTSRGVSIMKCKICGAPTYSFGKSKVLDKYWAEYLRCRKCHFVFVDQVSWLSEAYSDAINTSDLGLVGRNLRLSYSLVLLIRSLFKSDGKFVDYGGGYGLLVRLMRDMGLDFYRYDEFCANLFAKGLDVTPESDLAPKYELLVAIEVFEHLVDPIPEVRKMMQFSTNIFFATEVLPDDKEVLPGQWSYYGLEHGQHISLFTRKSLKVFAEKMGLCYSTNGKGLHLFSKRRIPNFLFRVLTTATLGKYGLPFLVRNSLLAEDYKKVTGHGF